MAIKFPLEISEVLYSVRAFFNAWLKSLFGTEWCDRKYHTILYTTVVAVCCHGICQPSFNAVKLRCK
jgi:hypothetical protein